MSWKRVRIDSMCDTGAGGTPSRAEADRYFGGDIPWVKSGELREDTITATEEYITQAGLDESAAKIVPTGALLVALYGATVGRIAILGIDAATNQAVCHIIPRASSVHSRFLYYALRNCIPHWLSRRVGGAQPNISQQIIKETVVSLPPIDVQRRIADILDRAESLRAQRRAALGQLDTLTQAIFMEMFGDPVTNPKRWPNSTVGDQLSFQLYGPRFYNEAYTEDGVRIIRITDLNAHGELDFGAMPRLAVTADDLEKYALRAGDIIFARTGATVGKVAMILASDPVCIAGAYFIMMRFHPAVAPAYARAVLTAPSIQSIVWVRSQQSAQQNFSGPGLRALPMPLPPLPLQQEFARRVAHVEQLRSAQRASLAKLDELFVSLQHRAFRGEL